MPGRVATKVTAEPAAEPAATSTTTILRLENLSDDMHQHLGEWRGAILLPGLLRIAALATAIIATLTLTLLSILLD